MFDIKLSGLDIEGNEKEFSLNDFKGQKLFFIFIQKITLQDVHKKPVIFAII